MLKIIWTACVTQFAQLPSVTWFAYMMYELPVLLCKVGVHALLTVRFSLPTCSIAFPCFSVLDKFSKPQLAVSVSLKHPLLTIRFTLPNMCKHALFSVSGGCLKISIDFQCYSKRLVHIHFWLPVFIISLLYMAKCYCV